MAALPFVFNNPSRPFLPFRGDPQTLWNTARETLLFRNNPAIQPGYESMSAALRATGCEQVGLRIDSSDPEYVIWALAAEFEHLVRFEHLFPDPPVVEGREQEYSPCAVICTICNKEVMYALPLHSVHPGGIRLYSQK